MFLLLIVIDLVRRQNTWQMRKARDECFIQRFSNNNMQNCNYFVNNCNMQCTDVCQNSLNNILMNQSVEIRDLGNVLDGMLTFTKHLPLVVHKEHT